MKDLNDNGIPDSQENDAVDLDNDGIPDIQQEDIKSLNTVVGVGQMGISRRDEHEVTDIEAIESVDPESISRVVRPHDMPLGLFGVRLVVENPGDTAEMTVYFSVPAASDTKWFLYDSINGWVDYSDHARFSPDRTSVTLTFKDGGFGDADGVENRIIVDPGGFGFASWLHITVKDADSAQTITNAKVTIMDMISATDQYGNSMSILVPGTYEVDISANGYQSNGNALIQIEEGKTTNLEVLLRPATPGGDGGGDGNGFDWGSCSGSGSFQQQVVKDTNVEVGEIPAAKEGIRIDLTCGNDVDIRLFDKESGDMVIGWMPGDTSQKSRVTKQYRGTLIEYSGYDGVLGNRGNETIEIKGMTTRTFVMKAFGYASGYAEVNYSWTWTDNCTPDQTGEGTFVQDIVKNTSVVVGTLPPGLRNAYIELICDKDVDVQVFDKETGTRVIGWVPGDTSQKHKITTRYQGMDIEYSGYDGVDGDKGHEYIRVMATTNRFLEMKAFAYDSGYATIRYAWGQ
jgi:hypothetical protein